ncbi:MAG: glutamate racemase [Pseudomonadota bacterium]
MNPSAPVGVFDSGVGGLSVLREIRRALPGENLIYVADSGHAPYGDQPSEFIEGRASAVVRFLLDAGAKAITIACNTATVVAVEKLRAWSPVPIVAIEPAIKPAAAATKSGVIGVLATRATLASGNVSRLVALHASQLQVHLQPCSGLVEQVERGDLSGPETRALVAQYVEPLLAQGVDTLVLGCTHYPFLEPLIRDIAGPGVAILDPAPAVARELARRLDTQHLRNAGTLPGSETFFSSGEPAHAQRVMPLLWGQDLTVREFRS